MITIDVTEIDWQQTIPIRQQVLWPDKPAEFCKLVDDENGIHLGGFVEGRLVCVASLFIDGNVARLRKYATLPEYQGKGIGSAVLNRAISLLKRRGIEAFWCDARVSATGFYNRFGMQVQGDSFYKSGVEYVKMSIDFSSC